MSLPVGLPGITSMASSQEARALASEAEKMALQATRRALSYEEQAEGVEGLGQKVFLLKEAENYRQAAVRNEFRQQHWADVARQLERVGK